MKYGIRKNDVTNIQIDYDNYDYYHFDDIEQTCIGIDVSFDVPARLIYPDQYTLGDDDYDDVLTIKSSFIASYGEWVHPSIEGTDPYMRSFEFDEYSRGQIEYAIEAVVDFNKVYEIILEEYGDVMRED